jgi:hypothetical protein
MSLDVALLSTLLNTIVQATGLYEEPTRPPRLGLRFAVEDLMR